MNKPMTEYERQYALLKEEIAELSVIFCPDNPGGWHRFDGDGQCKDCGKYATNLIDAACRARLYGGV